MTQDQVQNQFDLSDAPDTSTPFTNIGKLTLRQVYKLWENKVSREVTREEYKAAKDVQDDGKNAKQIDMKFSVDIQEFVPALQFTYERDVTVDSADWRVIVASAIEEVMGKGSMVKGDTKKNVKDTRNDTLAKLNGKYIAYQDVPQVPRRNAAPGAKVYNTIRLTQVFESREQAHTAHVALRGAGNVNGTGPVASDPNIPPDYDAETWASVRGEAIDAVNAAITAATNAHKTRPVKLKEAAIARAKSDAIEKFASEYSATPEQVEKLLNS